MKSLLLLLYLISANLTLLYASNYPDRGIGGSLGYTYEDENYNIDDSITSQQRLIQEYKLKYEGNIYNPNLVNYRLSGLFRFEKINQKIDTNNRTSDANSEDYRFDASFIQNSKFPFRIYYNTSNKPTNTIYANTSINLLSKRENYGLFGLVKLNKFNFDYEASKDTTSDEDTEGFLERAISKYGGSLRYTDKKDNMQLRYMHILTDSTFINFTQNTKSNIEENDLSLSYGTRLTKDLSLSSSANYTDTSMNNGTIMDARLGLNWNPKADYDGNIDMSLGRVDFYFLDDLNISAGEVLDRTDTLDIDQNFNYRPMEGLLFLQGINYFSYERPDDSFESRRLKLGAIYMHTKQLNPQRTVSFRSSLRTQLQKTAKTDFINRTNVSETDNQYTLEVKADISEQLPSWKSILKIDTDYNGIRTSTMSDNEYGINLSLNSRFGKFNNSFYANYTTSYFSVITRYGDTINYATKISFKGMFNASIGTDVQETTSDTANLKSKRYMADAKFRYRFFSRLLFFTSLHMDKDLGYNTLKYDSQTELKYTRGLTSISISYKYDYANNQGSDATRNILQLKFKRTF